MKTIYLQLGYPKCFSTTLQRSFYEPHPEIAFGGVGIGDNISYANKDIEFVFECLLKYANRPFFNMHVDAAGKAIEEFIAAAGNRKIVFSSEHLIFPFSSQHLDYTEICSRVKQLFGEYDVHVLLVLRKQGELLKSLYGEFIKMGYTETYSSFIHWVSAFRDRNFWAALNYWQVYQYLSEKFGRGKVHVHFFEGWKADPENLINDQMSKLLDITNRSLPIQNDNPSLNVRQLANLLVLNRESRRGMGQQLLYPFEFHRNRVLLDRLDAGYSHDEVFQNVYEKRAALSKLDQMPQQSYDSFFALNVDAAVAYEKMKGEWINSNIQLEGGYGRLPEGYTSL